MVKIGRNQPCTCGSGKKFKHCHGAILSTAGLMLPPEIYSGIERKRQEMEAIQRRRQQQQGLGRPIISEQVSGRRVVAVGRRLYHSIKWRTFHDFLRDYLLGSLGPEWANAEQAKPLAERHQILRWYAQASEQARSLQVADGTMISGPMSGAMRAFMNLAYNVYLIAHHGEGQAMADIYLRRLRSARADDFTGALFETYAAAAFLKAGFKLAYEETARRSTSCVEFVATWPKTGDRFSVEVKSRVHEARAVPPADGAHEAKRLRVGAKLVKALSKAADHTRVVMIEVNVPEQLTEGDRLEGWAAAAVSQIRGNEIATRSDGSLYPPAYVFVTNHAFHHDLAGTGSGMQVVADGFRISDFGPDVRYRGYGEILAARERHAPMMALIESLRTHYEIPATFGGELPGSLVAPEAIPRLRIGQRYLVPDGSGAEVPGRLESATVLEVEKLVYGIYELDDGRRIIATNPLTPDELADYRRYPDTFFDAVTPVGANANTYVEKCDFLFKTYQHSTREKLLEFMANATDIKHLQTLGQRDLAIIYCERMAHAMQLRDDAHKTGAGSYTSDKVPSLFEGGETADA
jgi:hypothetical protein